MKMNESTEKNRHPVLPDETQQYLSASNKGNLESEIKK